MTEPKTVLVIDDASLVRMYYRGALEGAGYRVEEALNGIEAASPGTKHAFYFEFLDKAADRFRPEAADARLFQGATWVLTPTARTDHAALTTLSGVLRDLGARVLALEPALHDQLVAVTSHLPQVAAFADQQVSVAKRDLDGTTVSEARLLTEDERVLELSRMLSGNARSEAAREHAAELLASASRRRR